MDVLEVQALLKEGDTKVVDGTLYLKAELVEAIVGGFGLATVFNEISGGTPILAKTALLEMVDILKVLRNDFVDEVDGDVGQAT